MRLLRECFLECMLSSRALRHSPDNQRLLLHLALLSLTCPARYDEVKRSFAEMVGKPICTFETYIHYPFCEQLCGFCHFHKEIDKDASTNGKEQTILSRIQQEMLMYRELAGSFASTVIAAWWWNALNDE